MKPGSDIRLRDLVLRANSLTDSVERLSKAGHPLGLGIARQRRYPTPTGPVSLPTFGDGLARLKTCVRELGPGLDSRNSSAAWNSVLDRPALIIPVAVTSGTLLSESITPSSDQMTRIRRVVLASVLHHGDEALDAGIISSNRLAVIATLTVVMNAGRGGGAEDGWLSVVWPESTRALVTALEPVFSLAGWSPCKGGKRVGLLISERFGHLVPIEVRERLDAAAAIAGISLEVHTHTASSHANVAASLDGRRPSHLLVLGDDAAIRRIRDKYAAAEGEYSVTNVDPGDVLATLREKFASLMGVAPSLLPVYQVEEPLAFVKTLPAMPIQPTQCRHVGGIPYLLDAITGLWWTRDFAQHGEVVFKTYTKNSTHFVFEADRTAVGNAFTDKHKGGVLTEIPLGDSRGCAHPASHIKAVS